MQYTLFLKLGLGPSYMIIVLALSILNLGKFTVKSHTMKHFTHPHPGFISFCRLVFWCVLIKHSASRACYYPDGSAAALDIPCQDTNHSACCGPDSYCLANNLCIQKLVLTRSSCTDQTWKAPECPYYCRDGMFDAVPFFSLAGFYMPMAFGFANNRSSIAS